MTTVSKDQSHFHVSSTRAYFMWFSCALFFFYQYILRVSPGVLVDDLRHDFSLTAEQFGTFGAYYLYAYSLLQIPLGILVDRIGLRKMVVGSMALCISGAALLWLTESVYLAQFSRVLVGAGSGSAFMCSLKVAADYFPAGKRGMLMGLTLSFGTLGALTAGKPLVLMLEVIGWRTTIMWTALLGLPVMVFAYFVIPATNIQQMKRTQGAQHLIQDILTILKNPMIMLYAALAIGLYTPLSALADLWGTAFLMQKYSLLKADAAESNMMMYVGMGLGSLFMPWLCEKYKILNQGIQISGFSLLFLFSYILFGPAMGFYTLALMFIAVGFFCGAEMSCFTGAVSYSTKQNSGLTIGVVNTMNMLGGAILQQIIGVGLDWQWMGLVDDYGIRMYSTEQYVIALSSLLVVLGLACIASLNFNRKSFAKLPASA